MVGEEITVDSYIVDGKPIHTPLCKYILSENLGFNDHHLPIRIMPYDVSPEDLSMIFDVTEQAYKALGADNCCTHTELFYDSQNHTCRVIEVAARSGGFRSEMFKHCCGGDLNLAAIQVALRMHPDI